MRKAHCNFPDSNDAQQSERSREAPMANPSCDFIELGTELHDAFVIHRNVIFYVQEAL
jgi:hypothetical protein